MTVPPIQNSTRFPYMHRIFPIIMSMSEAYWSFLVPQASHGVWHRDLLTDLGNERNAWAPTGATWAILDVRKGRRAKKHSAFSCPLHSCHNLLHPHPLVAPFIQLWHTCPFCTCGSSPIIANGKPLTMGLHQTCFREHLQYVIQVYLCWVFPVHHFKIPNFCIPGEILFFRQWQWGQMFILTPSQQLVGLHSKLAT